MSGEYPRAISIAQRLVEEYGISAASDIDIEAIAFDRGVLVVEGQLQGADGRLIRREGKGIIRVSSGISEPGQRRFCAAHELGHFELHRKSKQSALCTGEMLFAYTGLKEEQESNVFASELLMPCDLFSGFCPKSEPSFSLICDLAEEFRTSLTATIYRYVEIGPHVSALIICRQGRIQSWKPTSDFHWRLPTPGQRVCEFTGAGEFFAGKSFNRKVESVMASDWLEDPSIPDTWTIRELTIPLPRYLTTLTLIWPEAGSPLDESG